MSVEKAKAAIDRARELLDGVERDHAGLIPLRVEAEFTNMLAIARVHADVAQAEALERIADVLERPRFSVPEVLDRFADHVARGERFCRVLDEQETT